MKIFPLVIPLTALIFNPFSIVAQSETEPNRVVYQCEQEQSLQVTFLAKNNTYPNGAATVTFPDGKTLTLPSVISASGAKYSDNQTTFWAKGEQALIEVNGKMTINNCLAVQNDSNSQDTTAQANLEGTRWKLVQWGTETTPKTPLQNTLISAEFTSDRIAGSGGCNRYTGGYQVKSKELSFSPMASTRKACPPDIMNQELEFFTNLQAAKNYEINSQGQLQISYQTERGAGIMIFEPDEK